MKAIVVLPTYNERDNIKELIDEILEIDDSLNVLVVDDNSPDGTWKIVKEIANKDSRVKLFLRTEEKGRVFKFYCKKLSEFKSPNFRSNNRTHFFNNI